MPCQYAIVSYIRKGVARVPGGRGRGGICVLGKLCDVLAGYNRQHEQVRYGIRVVRLLLQGLLESGLGLFHTAEVDLADGLRDEGYERGGGGCLG